MDACMARHSMARRGMACATGMYEPAGCPAAPVRPHPGLAPGPRPPAPAPPPPPPTPFPSPLPKRSFELSDSTVKGEGELKILSRLLHPGDDVSGSGGSGGGGASDTHLVLGGDSDLLLMAMVAGQVGNEWAGGGAQSWGLVACAAAAASWQPCRRELAVLRLGRRWCGALGCGALGCGALGCGAPHRQLSRRPIPSGAPRVLRWWLGL